MRIHNIDSNIEETIEAGDIVSFEFGDKLAIEGMVVETEDGLEVQLDEQGEQYITELLPLAIAAGGLAWSAYDAYNAAKAYQAGEITKNDLAAQVGTDVALSLAGGALAKGASKGYKYFKKAWSKESPKIEPKLPRGNKSDADNNVSSISGRKQPPLTTKSATAAAPQADNVAGEIKDRTKKKDPKRNRNTSAIGQSGRDAAEKSDFLSKFGPHAQRGLKDDIQRLQQLAGLKESIITEGVWSVPQDMSAVAKLADIFKNPVKASEAGELVYGLTGADDLFDDFYELEEMGADTDARPTIARWIENNMDLIAANTDEPEEVTNGLAEIIKPFTKEGPFVSEGTMDDLEARIMKSDDPHDEIYKMLTAKGPEADYIRNVYNDTSADRGLHPDDDFEDIIDAMVAEFDDGDMFEAEYQGKKVTLNKPIRTGKDEPKKFKVYVKDGDKVKLVRFGHQGKGNEKTMKIKKSDPKRRKSFRARHNCKNPGPKTKARYWSCKAW